MSEKKKKGPEALVRETKRQTRRKFTSEEKIRIVLEGLREEVSRTPIRTIFDPFRARCIYFNLRSEWCKYEEHPDMGGTIKLPHYGQIH
jgi:transposase-like protein